MNLITAVLYCFTVVVAIFIGIVSVLHITGYINDPIFTEEISKFRVPYGANPQDLATLCSTTMLMALKAYQSSLVFRAMNRKDVALAKQAVRMMRIYMISTVNEQFWILIRTYIKYSPSRDELPTLIIESAVAIALNLAVFTSVYYFGASKVYKLLTEANKPKSVKAQ